MPLEGAIVDDPRRKFAALVRDFRAHFEGTAPPILIVHGDEPETQLSLLKNLAGALSNKVAPSRLIHVTTYTGETTRLLAATDTALAATPDLAQHNPFPLTQLEKYVQQPALRKGLWEELKAAFAEAS